MFKIFDITQDTYVQANKPTANFGQQAQLYVQSGSSIYRDLDLTYSDVTAKTLIQFNSQEILSYVGGTSSLNSHSIELTFNLSNLQVRNKPFSITAHPVTSSWSEGLGLEYNFLNPHTFPFDVYDNFYNTNYVYSCSVDSTNMKMTISLNDYLKDVANSEFDDYGIAIVSNDTNIFTMGMYSKQSLTELGGKVIIYSPNSANVTGSSILFNSGSSGSVDDRAINFKAFRYDARLKKGDTFNAMFSVEEFYKRNGFDYTTKRSFLNDVQFEIFNETHNQMLIPRRNDNVVSINGGLYLTFSTENFPLGKYWLRLIYEENGKQYSSNKYSFWVEI
jgi:hypothetical protein